MKSKLLCMAMLLSAAAFSQDSAFHLKDYKYRTPCYRALALNFNFSGNYTNLDANNTTSERQNQTNIGPVSVDYYRIRSTEKQLLESRISFGTSYRSYDFKTQQRTSKNKSFTNNISWEIQSRNYRKNQWFIEWGNAISGGLEFEKIGADIFHSQSTGIRATNTATIGVGKGRIEWVQDAQMPIYILQDLESQNLLNRQPTAQETNSFSQLITDINNRRIFDSRRRRIYELSRIDSFLKSSGLVIQTDIRHFTTVNDNWAFAINPFRQSGAAWFARLKPGVHFNRSRSTSIQMPQPSYSQQQTTSISVSPQIGYESFRPINLKWQQNFAIAVNYKGERFKQTSKQVQTTGENVFDYEVDGGRVSLETSYGVGFYPNTRTQLQTEIAVSPSHSNERWELSPSFNFVANYFIGYRTYLRGDLSASYHYFEIGNDNAKVTGYRLFGDFSVRLSHFIF